MKIVFLGDSITDAGRDKRNYHDMGSGYPKFAVEHIRAHAGMDIGGPLIGMHLRDVAVPLRLSLNKIGEANVVFARTRPKYIGGERARYC